jgi:hypothetical protein
MGVSLFTVLVISGVLLVTVASVVVGLYFVRRRRDVALREHDLPLLVMPLAPPQNAIERPRLAREVTPVRVSPTAVSVIPAPVRRDSLETRQSWAEPTSEPEVELEPITDVVIDGDGELVRGHSVRYFRANEGTLEFLPGRLEIVGGADTGQEIRFIKTYGDDAHIITFGRSDGPAFRHVQLLEPTVSRQHAKMELEHGSWRLMNLSRTNPVAINGAPLDREGDHVELADGDRIEMGEVVFRFRAR